MKKFEVQKLIVAIILFLPFSILANNIAVSNMHLTGQNTTDDFTLVQFNISWENSWRISTGASNWDAAWVFVKYRVAGGAWQHAWLNDAGHTAPTGSTITPASDGTGAFIYRNANGSGTFSLTGVQLRWNYGANGVADDAIVDIQVFAVEMVYVPQGNFYVGDGTTTTVRGQFTAHNTTGNFQITSESVPATLVHEFINTMTY